MNYLQRSISVEPEGNTVASGHTFLRVAIGLMIFYIHGLHPCSVRHQHDLLSVTGPAVARADASEFTKQALAKPFASTPAGGVRLAGGVPIRRHACQFNPITSSARPFCASSTA
jgi:hypothetical protein